MQALEHLRVAERQLPDPHPVLHLRRQVQQAEQVADRRPVHAEPLGELLLLHVEAVEVVLEPLGLFDRVQVAPLDVLDQGGLEHLLVVEVDDADRDLGQAGPLGGPQPPLAGDQLESVAGRPDDHRLQDAVLADAGGQLGELVVVERFAGLVGVSLNPVDGDDGRRAGRRSAGPAIRASSPRPSRGF